MRAIRLHDGDFDEAEFCLFSQWPFCEDEGDHVGFILEDSRGIVAITYAWNLDSIEQVDTAIEVEIALIEVRTDLRGQGLGTQLMQELEARYTVTVYGVENGKFFSGLGYTLGEQKSSLNSDGLVWTK